jgi:carboxymethylenebutenolidase
MEDKVVEQLVNEYKSGKVSRRQFLKRATVLLGGAALADALLLAASGAPIHQVAAAAGLLTEEATSAATAASTAAATMEAMPIDTQMVEFKAGTDNAPGYLARPKADGKYPAVVVIQEWWGLDDHIKSVTERFAGQGFAALAPDLYRGKVAKEPSEAQKLVMQVQMDQAIKDIQGAVNYLVGQDYVSPKKAGVVGFCYGGGIAMRMSYTGKDIGAVVVFYGAGVDPSDDDLKNVSAPLLGLYGGKDQSIPQDKIKMWEAKLKEFGKTNEMVIYPDAGHAFLNDTRPSYSKEAATDGWARALAWFKKYLMEQSS